MYDAFPQIDRSTLEEGDVQKPSTTTKSAGTNGATKMESADGDDDTPPIFPTPKYIFNIFSPSEMLTSENNIAQQNLVKTRGRVSILIVAMRTRKGSE